MISGLEETRVVVGEASYFVAHGGAGSPVLLLHGFPETHACWQQTAPRLTAACRIIAADLPPLGIQQTDRRPAVRACDSLGVKTAVVRIVELAPAVDA